MLHTGFRIQNQMHQLGIKLENAEITAKQAALAVGSADTLCALHVEMLEVVNQHQSLKNPISFEYQKLSWSLRTSSEMKSWGNLASEGSANAGSSGNENDGAAF